MHDGGGRRGRARRGRERPLPCKAGQGAAAAELQPFGRAPTWGRPPSIAGRAPPRKEAAASGKFPSFSFQMPEVLMGAAIIFTQWEHRRSARHC
jgi:hypothetical protein